MAKSCTCDPDTLTAYGCSCQPLPRWDGDVPAVRADWWNLPVAAWAWREDGRDRRA